jgi:hypothetical protein
VGIVPAAEWGLAGGIAASLVALSAAIAKAGNKWPWRGNSDGIWPQLFVTGTGIAVGALVAAAAHSQMSGAWPAFLMGVSAPSVIRGAIARVEVEEAEPATEPGAGEKKVVPPARGQRKKASAPGRR